MRKYRIEINVTNDYGLVDALLECDNRPCLLPKDGQVYSFVISKEDMLALKLTHDFPDSIVSII